MTDFPAIAYVQTDLYCIEIIFEIGSLGFRARYEEKYFACRSQFSQETCVTRRRNLYKNISCHISFLYSVNYVKIERFPTLFLILQIKIIITYLLFLFAMSG